MSAYWGGAVDAPQRTSGAASDGVVAHESSVAHVRYRYGERLPSMRRPPSGNRPMSSQPQSTSTLRRQWILWTTLIVALVLVVGFFLFVIGLIALEDTGNRPTVGDAFTTGQRYYGALQRHDYPTAYTYLQPNAVVTTGGQDITIGSAQALTSAAEQAEQADGAIVTVASADGNFEQGKQLVDMTLHVTRANRVYDVHLQVAMTTRAGKILRADGL
jgi:hypothetical protein